MNRGAPTCNDDGWHGRKSAITAAALTAGTYCLVVDGYGSAAIVNQGEYDLFVVLASTIP
jgi:hypothetical protein